MTTRPGSLGLPLYADRPQRLIPGTRCVAVTMFRSDDGTVAHYAVLTDDGKGHLGTAYYQPRSRTRSRGYALTQSPRINDDHWRTLTEYALEIGRRNGLDVSA